MPARCSSCRLVFFNPRRSCARMCVPRTPEITNRGRGYTRVPRESKGLNNMGENNNNNNKKSYENTYVSSVFRVCTVGIKKKKTVFIRIYSTCVCTWPDACQLYRYEILGAGVLCVYVPFHICFLGIIIHTPLCVSRPFRLGSNRIRWQNGTTVKIVLTLCGKRTRVAATAVLHLFGRTVNCGAHYLYEFPD